MQIPSPEEEEYDDDPEMEIGESPIRTVSSIRTATPLGLNTQGWLLEWRIV